MQVPVERALAFISAMVGWEDVGECQARPKSPHMWTHLEAVLGRRDVPSSDDFPSTSKHSTARAQALVEYLRGVAKALEGGVR